MSAKECPKGHGPMKRQTNLKSTTFRGVELEVAVKEHVCPECGLTAADIAATADVQHQIAEGYRKKMGLLTGTAIRDLRQAKGLTQEELADLIEVGVASIKRWEKSNIQSASMDKLLRTYLMDDCPGDVYHGNRPLSLPRIKLVIKQLEGRLNRRLIKKTDKFLFVAKYLWYADMLAYQRLGRGLTGAAYAAITYGPQLNNYRDLIDEIKDSDTAEAEPLSAEEMSVIEKVAKTFPEDRMVYDAAHREHVWQDTPTGYMISYALASELIEISD
ncbi:MAG: DUF4065 domain-containing protein [Desulfobacterales bacterium]|nr:DUF4065 domain-containing protein [Desulfobacterales bacterium]